MGKFYVLLIRLVLSIVISVVVGRLFFPGIGLIKIGILAIMIFGLAYLFEYLRKIGSENRGGG